MKQIEKPKLKSFFLPEKEDSPDIFLPLSVSIVRWLQPHRILTYISLLTIIFSGFDKKIIYLNISLYIYFLYIYFSTLKFVEGLHVERVIDEISFHAMQDVELNYTLINSSPVSCEKIVIIDDLGLSQSPIKTFTINKNIRSYSTVKFTKVIKCDGGMGKSFIGPLKINICDSFSFFNFEIIYDQKIEVYVYPKIDKIHDVKYKVSKFPNYGSYEIPLSGDTVVLNGLREYVTGDSLKYISWKKSAQKNQLMVKQFERNITYQVGIVMNLDPLIQIGHKGKSTWEKNRSATLSLVANIIEQGGSLKFLMNNKFISSNSGRQQFNDICKSVTNVSWFDGENCDVQLKTTVELLDFASLEFKDCDSIFVVSNLFKPLTEQYVSFARKMHEENIRVHYVFIKGQGFLSSVPLNFRRGLLTREIKFSPQELKDIKSAMNKARATVDFVGIETKINQLFIEKPLGLL